jgi:hypothetical protein
VERLVQFKWNVTNYGTDSTKVTTVIAVRDETTFSLLPFSNTPLNLLPPTGVTVQKLGASDFLTLAVDATLPYSLTGTLPSADVVPLITTNLGGFEGSGIFGLNLLIQENLDIGAGFGPNFTIEETGGSHSAQVTLVYDYTVPGISPSVPEPSTWAMMILGFAGLGYMGFRRRRMIVA